MNEVLADMDVVFSLFLTIACLRVVPNLAADIWLAAPNMTPSVRGAQTNQNHRNICIT